MSTAVLPTLMRTQKFEVWNAMTSSLSKTKKDKEIILNPKAMKRVSCSEVVLVSFDSYFITIETNGETNRASYSKNDVFDSTTIYRKCESLTYYPIEICRAALFSLLVTLLYSTNHVRIEVIEYIADMLNNSLIPAISTQSESGDDLLLGLIGSDLKYQYYTNNGLKTTSTAFSSSRMKPLTLLKNEIPYIRSDIYLWRGTACLLSAASTFNISNIIDCFSALSCEAAYSSFLDYFDPSLYENNRAHRGEITSATNMKLLLEGSKRHHSSSTNTTNAISAFINVPQSNGPAIDYFTKLSK